MSNIFTLVFTCLVVGEVLLARETTDQYVGLILLLYVFVYKFIKKTASVPIKTSIICLFFMYVSFLRHQHDPVTERFAVWTVIFLATSLVTQGYQLIRLRKSKLSKSL